MYSSGVFVSSNYSFIWSYSGYAVFCVTKWNQMLKSINFAEYFLFTANYNWINTYTNRILSPQSLNNLSRMPCHWCTMLSTVYIAKQDMLDVQPHKKTTFTIFQCIATTFRYWCGRWWANSTVVPCEGARHEINKI